MTFLRIAELKLCENMTNNEINPKKSVFAYENSSINKKFVRTQYSAG